jgi:parallel beta-helix repeat protein
LNNSISANKDGIQLGNTDNCTINENEVSQNENGIVLSQSTGNRLWDNNVRENQYALQFDRSKNNSLLDNNFINNTQQLTSINSTSYLDNGVEGNYWDNYTGRDANQDAIGDTPYSLAENSTDNHPLMGPFSYYAIPFEAESYYVNFISNSKILEIRYDNNARIMSFNVTGSDGTAGFCRLPIPKMLVSAPQVVLFDGVDVNARSLPLSNSTHTFLYFTYALSNHQVTIVSKTYYDLLKEYNALLAEYLSLNSTYNTLVADYSALDEKYTQLENVYNNLNLTYNQLTSDYETLQGSYNTLSASYASLNSTYNSLRTSFEELNLKYSNATNEINNIRNLTYALIAGIIIIAAVLLPTNMVFRRKINRQNKIIEAYNPLELARTLFMEDVKSRGAKIDKFQSKYGVKIQTRNTLEDVIKSLEKEKKK